MVKHIVVVVDDDDYYYYYHFHLLSLLFSINHFYYPLLKAHWKQHLH